MSVLEQQNIPKTNTLAIQAELDLFEDKLKKLKISYEQYFCHLLPLPPDKEYKKLELLSKKLLRLPFRNAQTNFRLKNLVLRFQTLSTHWERVMQQKLDGTYIGDQFRAKARAKILEKEKYSRKIKGTEEESLLTLYNSYIKALSDYGLEQSSLEFDKFKSDIENKKEIIKKTTGSKNISFRIEASNGKVSIKAKKLNN